MKFVALGLSLSSSWGNGHATTYRALLKGLKQLGHETLFLERRTPWYSAHADLTHPDYCNLAFYQSVDDLKRWAHDIMSADLVLIGSYVPEGVPVIDHALRTARDRVAFYDIDTPVTLSRLDTDACDYIAARQAPCFTTYFSFAGGPSLDVLERRYGVRDAEALYCGVDAACYEPTHEAFAWDMGYLGTYSEDRQPALDELLLAPACMLPHMRFVVAGPQYPASINWPANVTRIEHLAPAEHASFYSRQRFTLNVTRAAMVRAGWSPSVRLFEAACCGAAIISDVWTGLETIFSPGRDIVLAESRHDVIAALTHMAPEASRRVGARARTRVLANHTGVMRARQIVAAAQRANLARTSQERSVFDGQIGRSARV